MLVLKIIRKDVFTFLPAIILLMGACRSASETSPGEEKSETVYRVSTGRNENVVSEIGQPGASEDDHHYSSIRAALEASRGAPEDREPRIVIHGGAYYLDQPLNLSSEDNGLTLEAAPGTSPSLYGGRAVTGWEQEGDRFYAADVPVPVSGEQLRLLVVNGEMRPRARLPEAGYFEHNSTFNVEWPSASAGGWEREPTWEELTTLTYKPGQIGPDLKPENAELTVYHKWDTSQVALKSIDRKTHTLTFSNPAGHPPGAFGVQKYVIWNTRQGLHEPGRWYVDRTRDKIVYWPKKGEQMDEVQVLAPVTERVIRILGASDITLRGLEISVTTTPMIAGGFGASQFPGAVEADYVTNGQFENIHIHNVAGQGLKVKNEQGVNIENSKIHSTGACGIIAPGTTIRNNRIHHIGRLYPAAIGIRSGGKGSIIARNTVHHTPYTAINCGGYSHRITDNHLHHAMQEMHDGAAIYTFSGRDIVIRGNYAHDITDKKGSGTAAYYLDEQSRNCVLKYNLSRNVEQPVNNHMAQNNTIHNNVFVNDGTLRLNFPRSSGYTFSNNVLVADGPITFRNGGAIDSWTSNVLYSRSGEHLNKKLNNYEVIPVRAFSSRVTTPRKIRLLRL